MASTVRKQRVRSNKVKREIGRVEGKECEDGRSGLCLCGAG